MTKFEEDLNKKMDLKEVPMYFTQSGCSLTKKTYIETNWVFDTYKNWHSDEEFQAEKDARKKEYEIHQDIYSKTSKKLNEAELEITNLKSQLQQQALPVVPEDVAKLPPFDDMKEYVLDERLLTIREFLNKLDDKLNSDITEAEAWCMIHEDIAYRAMLDGYTVEKPQLFRLKLKNATISNYYLWLNQATGKVFVDKKFLDWTNHDNVKNIFTEQEIAKISDGAFVNNEAFELVPVEDGE